MRALVCFEYGARESLWLKLFCRKGDPIHCWVAVDKGSYWLVAAMESTCVVGHAVSMEHALSLQYRKEGHGVVEWRGEGPGDRTYPPCVMTCVELVKRTLGIHKPLLLTPGQLLRHLEETK